MEMVKTAQLTAIVACLTGTCLAYGPHGQPPEDDPYLTNRFGRSWCEPVWKGFYISDNQYIDAPYVVEQRGYMLFVNGIMAGEGVDVRSVLPPSPPEPVTEDPGFPSNISIKTPARHVILDPQVKAKRAYIKHTATDLKDRILKEKVFFESLPCIQAVQMKEFTDTSYSLFLTDRSGGREHVVLGDIGANKEPIPSDKAIYETLLKMRDGLKRSIEQGGVFGCTNGMKASYPLAPSVRTKSILETFANDDAIEDKIVALKNLGFLEKHDTIKSAAGFFPIQNFKFSDQLWERFKPGEPWKADGADMLQKLTNGWVKIPPKFMREAGEVKDGFDIAPQRRSAAFARPPDDLQATTQIEEPVASSESASQDKAAGSGSEKPEPKPSQRVSTHLILYLLIGLSVLTAAGFLFLRRR